MSFSVHGQAVSRGVAIGRAVLVASSRVNVAHYFIAPGSEEAEVARLRAARNAVVQELAQSREVLAADSTHDTTHELAALLEVHLMLLQDRELVGGVKRWIYERHYNAEWALTTQLEQLARQFDEMADPYLRERKADLEQVVERVLRHLQGAQPVVPQGAHSDDPLILVAHDLSPADMLQFRHSVFVGFATDVGGKTSHTAIVARSMDIPAVVGARSASQLVRQDDWLVLDGDAGVLLVQPSAPVLAHYRARQQQAAQARAQLAEQQSTPACTLDGQAVELLANIELPSDTPVALAAGAVGVGLFRTEFLFMGRADHLPDEEEQTQAYTQVVQALQGRALTLRSIDIGADKPLERAGAHEETRLNPALGLRAIRWSLAEPEMFLTQLRAVLRAAQHGPVRLLLPMISHPSEVQQALALLAQARVQLQQRGQAFGALQVGVMVEVPAVALALDVFLPHFDFVSIGTNDLIQYTLAIDRADEAVAHLYDPMHPAVLRLVRHVIQTAQQQGKHVSVCGEMAGEPGFTRLLLGLGLRSFSMHPAQIAAVKHEVLSHSASEAEAWAQGVLGG